MILSKMYELKTFEEVELDMNLGNLKQVVTGPQIVKQIKNECNDEFLGLKGNHNKRRNHQYGYTFMQQI